MHELAIAQELTSIVLETAEKENLAVVSRVNVIFGRMIQIVPEIFEFAFRESVRESIAGEALLSIKILPVRIRCHECEEETEAGDMFFACSKCGSRNIEIIQGKEIYIESIEGE
jgi:hydrogenase nickel incorporation protein HypA/HybF